MLRLRNLSNKFQKRTLRPIYGQTQAYPYAATLDSTFRATDGSLAVPVVAASANPARTAAAALLKGGLVPGLVMTLVPGGETVKVAVGNSAFQASGGINGTTAAERPFGLLGNFIAGELDELGDYDEVGVWRGPGSVFELLAPAFGTITPAVTNAGLGTPLYAGTDGRLTSVATTSAAAPAFNDVTVARLIQMVGTSRIIVELAI